jgi:hypothetical protein
VSMSASSIGEYTHVPVKDRKLIYQLKMCDCYVEFEVTTIHGYDVFW